MRVVEREQRRLSPDSQPEEEDDKLLNAGCARRAEHGPREGGRNQAEGSYVFEEGQPLRQSRLSTKIDEEIGSQAGTVGLKQLV